MNLGWKSSVLPHDGFGYLIPSKEKEELLGVVWDSSTFPQQNRTPDETRLTAILGGAHRKELLKLTDEALMVCVRKSLSKHLGIEKAPEVMRVTRAEKAIPQYTVGHFDRLHALECKLAECSKSRIQLIGSAWHGVSLNDCIEKSMQYII